MNFLQIRIHERIRGDDAGLRAQLVILSEAKDLTDASISIAGRKGRTRRGQVNDRPAQTIRQTYLLTACPTGSRIPASLASFSALSVASHVKSGSVRPKCPYAAVFL